MTNGASRATATGREHATGAGGGLGVLAALLVSGFGYGLAAVMVIPALGQIGGHYHLSGGSASWALTINLLGGTVTTPIIARLADRHGHRLVGVIIMAGLAVGSVVCILAPGYGAFLAGRFIQSLASAIFPIGFSILRATQPPRRLGLGIGLLSAMTGLGGIGLPLSGILLDASGLAGMFVPAVVLGVVGALALGVTGPRHESSTGQVRMDWAGAGLLAVGLAAILLGIDRGPDWGWASAAVIALLAAGAAVLAGWVIVERRVAAPLVSMRVFTQRPVLMSNISAFFIGFGMYAAYVVIPELVTTPASTGYGFGRSVAVSGLVLLPAMVLLPAGVQVAARVTARTGPRPVLIASVAVMIVSFAWPAVARHTLADLIGAGVLLGLAVGGAYAVLPTVIAQAVAPADTGVATGINQIARAGGGAFGTAIAATLLASLAGPDGVPHDHAYTVVFTVLAIGTALAILSALGLGPHRPCRCK
ncbi:MFS transporter [Pseudonocardia acaciae]|uniref:MFS transporter n=1 Tax=Pseudonocardia acaciae TaxID=551276 RepID=UPI0012EEC5EE|nr:MFS transporter [Pseudonocardia acaciae]